MQFRSQSGAAAGALTLTLTFVLTTIMPFNVVAVQPVEQPNIIFVLTDDEDTVLGGDSPEAMPAGLPALSARGATAKNWFVNTPVCAVSRSEILTGKYYHNLQDVITSSSDPWDQHGNSYGPCFSARPAPRGCGPPSSAPGRNMHLNFSLLSPGPTFAQPLAAAGYKVGIFGKYLNRIPLHCNEEAEEAGGAPGASCSPQVPLGVDTWFVSPGDEANKSSWKDQSGEYFPSFYYTNDGVWNNTELQYETAFLGNTSMAWLRDVAATKQPFFMYLAPHSPHGAALPAPWYESLQINATAPRSPSYNYSGLDHHWLIEQQKPLTLREATSLDLQFEKRWRCLRATDDLLLAMESELTTLDLWSSTYIFFTADHGYHFGELRLGPGKWNVYDTDVRVPMRIVGPGVDVGSSLGFVGSHVDLAATWLGLGGVAATPHSMDGRSLVAAIVKNKTADLPVSVRAHLEQQEQQEQQARDMPEDQQSLPLLPAGGAYIEYHGLGLVGYTPPWYRLGDAWNNTYRALRVIDRTPGGLGNVLYAEFGSYNFDQITFHEYFDLEVDKWQMHNQFSKLTAAEQQQWAGRVASMHSCKGAACRS